MTVTGFVRSVSRPVVPELDDSQRAVVGLPDAASAAILGAPGSGKTTTLVEVVADRVLNRGWDPSQVLALASNRTAATALRDRLGVRLAVPTRGPLARTVNSLAYDIVASSRRAAGLEPPRLLTGGDQDSDIATLLDGHLEDGTGPDWPELLGQPVRRLRAFRTELREFMMRATEYGVPPSRLRAMAAALERPEWAAVAEFMHEYAQVMGGARPDQLDSAELASAASAILAADDPGELASGLRLVLVDDLQEATRSTINLLAALAARNIAIIAFGDPDVATSAFRGSDPTVLARLQPLLAVDEFSTLTLSTVHRQGGALRSFTSAITERIGSAGSFAQRKAQAAGADSPEPVVKLEAPTSGREQATIARILREQHLLHGTPWSDMAVITRSGAAVPGLARALALASVPTRTAVGGTPLRDDPTARSLIAVVDIGIGRSPLDAQVASDLLLGPFGGLDRITLRRLRLALRAEELAGDGRRSSDELLIEALSAPGRFATIDHRIARRAERMAKTLDDVRTQAAEGASIEELLWHVWERSGLADGWRAQALGAGVIAAEANRNLDGLLALFTAARRFVERHPELGPSTFLDGVLDAEVPEDTLSPQAAADSVLVTTPSGAVGLEFEIVVVTELQDGGWPNLRIRGSLLHQQEFLRALTGLDGVTIDERRAVLDDELRMFALAVSRARNRVVLSAVANEDESASAFLSLAPSDAGLADIRAMPPLTLRGMTGRLRRELTSGLDPRVQAEAASALARLAAEGVPGAHPDQWQGLLEPSTTEALFADDEYVRVSPSRLEAFEQSPLDWFIDSISGSEPSTAMAMGTIVHWAMETTANSTTESVWSAIESRWNELLFEAPWLAQRQKRLARDLASAVAEYLGDFDRDGKQLVGAEKSFTLHIDRALVSGTIDRVERASDGSVVIVDLKTGSPETSQTKIDAHPQLGAYQLAYLSGQLDDALAGFGAHTSGGAKLLYVKDGKGGKSYREGIQAPLTEEQLEGFRERIRLAAIGMTAAEFEGLVELDEYRSSPAQRLHRVRAVTSD
ncbi:ATP-dependent DNA helicase [Cryobacterium sp. BB307]|uniref:ATP-dependent helicase n=1 Tax=Cryobacterium sp. BB307 TaxID=2716317 RepID=UPI0014453992|nr:ATP-dependent DNA helicase [Cryobacterium sp. BB307]